MESSQRSSDPLQSGKLDNKKSKEDGGEPGPKKPGSKAQGRKRTKSGCLTCRRRRIKCGEERPTCQNCTKSKRQCEGYNQRVVFKDPLSAYRPSFAGVAHVSFSGSVTSLSGGRHGESYQQPPSAQNPVPIAPKSAEPYGPAISPSEAVSISALPVTTPGTERRVYGFSGGSVSEPQITPLVFPPQVAQNFDGNVDTVDLSRIPEPKKRQSRSPQDTTSHYDFNALKPLVKQEGRDDPSPRAQPQISPLDWSAGPSSASLSSSQELFYDSNSRFPASTAFYQSYPTTSNWQPESITTTSVEATLPAPTPSAPALHTPLETLPRTSEQRQAPYTVYPQFKQEGVRVDPLQASEWILGQRRLLDSSQHYSIEEDEGPYDVSDDDVEMEEEADPGMWQGDVQDMHLRNNDLGIVVALQARQDTQDLSLRSFTSFIDRPDMLASYIPSPQSSPLRDSIAATIFCHFVNVTGPSMSMFERHPANPSLIFQGLPVPKSQQHIWTYTFPTLALQNPALLHAMLALASLHIAKLQDEPITASLKHYAISVRRVAKSVSLPTRRGHPATLAAAMLLAFYECWSADHQKWSNHLYGARQLVREIDFAGMTKYIKATKLQRRREERARQYQAQQLGQFYDDRNRFLPSDDVDENIVSVLMGRRLRYDEYGQILDDNAPDDGANKVYTERDLEIYETQRDLFWWYCKQDVYQSILGGGRLFMEYSLWSHCPPRSPLGRLNATYGTFDHLILLMGRLADFAAKDLKRKRLAMKANGGWRPPPSMGMGPPAGNPPGPQGQPSSFPQMPQQPPQMPQMPSFSGMVPGVGEAKLPMGFERTRDDSPQSTSSDDIDLETKRIEAEEEWQEIRNAFSVLEDHFGEDFEPLGLEYSAPIQTPFGTALQYRTYGIAGIWMNFYMALISCHRSHPSMPPAAMMAAGIAARQTASFANELGRIAAGISPDCSMTAQVSPGVGAALIESATCLFVSGVQYQNAAQRNWTVSRLQDIARLTGWQTAHAIAAGCETSWVKTAALGRGPPYTRIEIERKVPDIWSSSRRINRAMYGLSNEEKRLVIEKADRVHYALGILGVQEDFENLDLDNDEVPKDKK